MKNTIITLLFAACTVFTFTACGDDDSATEEFSIANGNVTPKFIKTLTTNSSEAGSSINVVTVNYDGANRVSSVSDGEDTSLFAYENGNLTNISGSNDNVTISELYEAPYDAFETGEVREYDSNLNPRIIDFLEEEYNNNTGTFEMVMYTATIEYEAQHNAFFYTLQAAGIIDVLDGVRLNFNMMPVPSEIVIARTLLPVNNFKKITYRDANGAVLATVTADYVYDSENYPTNSTVTVVDNENNTTNIYTTIFAYKN